MASSALRSALRSTGCMQGVNLRTTLDRSPSTISRELRRNSLPSKKWGGRLRTCPGSAIGGSPAALGLPLQVGASRTCGTLRWVILPSRSLDDWRCSMVASSSAMNQSIPLSITERPRRITGIVCSLPISSHAGAEAVVPPASSKHRRPITDRPAGVEGRPVLGPWEADFMLSARYGQGLLVLH